MMQFNPDGSLKLPNKTVQNKLDNENRMKNVRCIEIKKEMVNFSAPKRCLLHLRLSDAMTDNRFVETTYNYFKDKATVPTKIIKLNDKEFDIEIGTDFKRCSDCTNLIHRYKDFLDGNVIELKGNCTYEPFRRGFTEEDYFD
ncbi:MAG: hypothetical protein ACP5OA_02390 [Candidatus Woesearchaeota archaeon]